MSERRRSSGAGRQGLRGAGLAPDLLLPVKLGSERKTFLYFAGI